MYPRNIFQKQLVLFTICAVSNTVFCFTCRIKEVKERERSRQEFEATMNSRAESNIPPVPSDIGRKIMEKERLMQQQKETSR